MFNTNKVQGLIRGNVNMESLQDTATYDSNQKNIGFNVDIALEGAGSSLSVNGGKTNINADYKAVGQQSGIFTGHGGFDLTVDGKTTLIGEVITTTDAALAAGLNHYVSKGGITTRDIENTSSYEGDAISVGISLGMTDNKPQGNTNGLGYGTDGDSDSSITKGDVSGYNDEQGILTTDNRQALAGKFDNNGEEIYQRNSGGFYIFDKNGIQQPVNSPNDHGNTLGDQPAELYCLTCRRTGEPKKYGETTHGEDRYGTGNQKRYSTDEIEEMGVEYKKIDSGKN